MATPTRIANKTQWALADIVAAASDATDAWRSVFAIARLRPDPALLIELANLRDALSRLQQTARLAQRGEYEERK